ncbi:MAG TPA: HNH endonuclease signature motif containing protein [Bryobacteraceae bacterium]|jgi:hypothetical protein|nr:HNH endonuclease signature motif containing protein [Bryobacteraceae bacterium]
MIRRASDSVQISYSFHHNVRNYREKEHPPADYYLSIDTGRVSLELLKTPMPTFPPFPEMVEACRTAYVDWMNYVKVYEHYEKLERSIERELLSHFPIPEFVMYRYKGRHYAVLNKSLWSCSRSLAEEEWRVLISKALAREEAKLAAYVSGQIPKTSRREFITESVRAEVWRRDEAQCVRCGSRERLEFDHIIPVALGGSSTARNIQLLCEVCNRTKSDSIA